MATASAFLAWVAPKRVPTARANGFLDNKTHEQSQLQADPTSKGEACIFFALASLALIFPWLGTADALIAAHGSVTTTFLTQLLSAMLHLAAAGTDIDPLLFVVHYVTVLHATDLLAEDPRALRDLASRIKDFGTTNKQSNVALFAASAATYMVIEAFKKLSRKCGLNANQIEGLWTIAISMQLRKSTPQGNESFPMMEMIVGKPKEAQRRGDERELLAAGGARLCDLIRDLFLTAKKERITEAFDASRAKAHDKNNAGYAVQLLGAPLSPTESARLEAMWKERGVGIDLGLDTILTDALKAASEEVVAKTQPMTMTIQAAFTGGQLLTAAELDPLDAAEKKLHDAHITEARRTMSLRKLRTHMANLTAKKSDVSLDSFRNSAELKQYGRPFEGPIGALLASSHPRPALASASKQSKSHRASLLAILFAMLAQFAMSGAVATVAEVVAGVTHTYVFGAAITVGMCCWPRSWFYVFEFPCPVEVLRHTPPSPALLAFLDSSIVFWSSGVREKRRTFRLMQTTLALPSGGRIRFPIGVLSPAQADTMCIAILMVLEDMAEPAVVATYVTTGSREAAAKAAIAVLATVQPMFDYWNPFPFVPPV